MGYTYNLSMVLREIISEIGYSVFYTSVNYPLSYYVDCKTVGFFSQNQ